MPAILKHAALLIAVCDALAPNAVTSVIAAKLAEVEEPAALALAAKYEAVDLPSSTTTFVRTAAAKGEAPALLLLHGFDSSLFEYRRLLPQLEAQGVVAYAIDLVGWGLTTPKHGVDIAAKRRQVEEFVREVVQGPCVLAGASLGAAVVVDALSNGAVENVDKVALIGPQCFIDGAPPVPEWGARLGVRVLRSWPLRALANVIAYKDKSLGSKDAIRVGLLHCERDAWEDDAVAWLLGGGYSVSSLVAPALQDRNTLILWGDSDEILPPEDAMPQFLKALPAADIRYVDACGHVPHLEQPSVTAMALARFVGDLTVRGMGGAGIGALPGTRNARS